MGRTKVIKNLSNLDIIDYRIAEAELDLDGNAIYDNETGQPKWTGRTLEWSIKAGEELEFPEYVADYLLKIYTSSDKTKFLQEVKPKQ